jgi:hypothetical protein
MKPKARFRISRQPCALVSIAVAAVIMLLGVPAWAAETIEPSGSLLSAEPIERTMAQMKADEANNAQLITQLYSGTPIPFRPAVDEAAYDTHKARLTAQSGFAPQKEIKGPVQAALAPPIVSTNWEGLDMDESGLLFPADTHGAMGRGYFMEIVNSRLAVWRTGKQQQLFSVSLASFFGYFAQTLFDPRAMFDKTWKRWIVTAEAFPESDTRQLHFIAVSKSENPGGAYWVYAIDVNIFDNPDFFWDFPQVGQNQDAVIVTANVSDPGFSAWMFAIAKARLYNGLDINFPFYTGLCGTLAPPVVLDQNPNTYLICAPAYLSPGSTAMTKYTLTNASTPSGQTLTASTIHSDVPYFIPPDAPQPEVGFALDTLDARFGNWSTQIGDALYNTHCIGFGGGEFALNRWYEFDTVNDTVVNADFFWATSNSNDFLPHITANTEGDIFVVWTAVDSGPLPPVGEGFHAQMRISGKEAADLDNFLGPGAVVATSPTWSGLQDGKGRYRWGDYQSVDVFAGPGTGWGNGKVAFAVGQKIKSNTRWSSHISRIRLP